MTRIMKFGGAAVADADAIRNVARIVAAEAEPHVVVTSAMAGVTDLLAAAPFRVADDEKQVFVVLDELRQRHLQTLKTLAPDDEAAQYALRIALEHLERLLYGIAYTQETTPRLCDLVESFGERLAAPLVAAGIRLAGRDAVALDAEHAGVRTLGPFRNARPDLYAMANLVPERLEPHLEAGRIPVVTGYYGVDERGHPSLFGRGGSDYVASLLAVSMGAEAVELWKDVPGFLTSDPRAIPDAVLVPELGYDEAAELAHFGAKVLHPRAVEPLEPHGVPIHIRSLDAPDAPGTVIRAQVGKAPRMVRSCASKGNLGILRLNGPGMAYTPGVAKQVFDPLAAAGINILNLSTSQATFALLLEDTDMERAHKALEPLVGGVVQSIEAMRERSLVCVVGRGLGETPGSAARILDAVGSRGVNIEMISLGASDIAIDFIVQTHQRNEALRGIHDAFLGGTP